MEMHRDEANLSVDRSRVDARVAALAVQRKAVALQEADEFIKFPGTHYSTRIP